MKKKSLFHDYLQQPGAKPMWQLAYESGAGSLEFLRQVGRGQRKASPSLARGIEIATGGFLKKEDIRPDIADEVWGSAAAVHERMRKAAEDPDAVRDRYLVKG